MAAPLVSDELWSLVAPLLPPHPPRPKGGRPPIPDRACFTGSVFVLKTGIHSSARLGGHRWVVERTFAHLTQRRRLVIRYERRADIYQAFCTLGCALLGFKHLTR